MGPATLGTERRPGPEHMLVTYLSPAWLSAGPPLCSHRSPGRAYCSRPHSTIVFAYKSAPIINHGFLETVPYSSLFLRA